MSIDPIAEMSKCIKCLKEEDDIDRQLEALGTLRDWCEDMNFAIGKFVNGHFERTIH